VFAEALTRIAARLGSGNTPDWLDYPNQRAEAPLRAAVCGWMEGWELGPVHGDDIALSQGGQSAINLIFQCCLRGERPVVLTEDLAYPGFRHAARLARADVVTVPMDSEGMLPDALEAACRKHGPQILCLTVAAQNPTAVSMSLSRREALVAIARAHDLQIVEDECYSIVSSTIPSLRALAQERTWHVGGVSKTVSAALRFGYVICPPGMGDALRLTAQHGFFALARPVSDLCLDLLSSGAAAGIRDRVRAGFAERLNVVVAALEGQDLSWQPGLPIAWLRLPHGWRDTSFTRIAMTEGVLVRAADEFSATHARVPNAVRLALPGGTSIDGLSKGMVTLVRLLKGPPSECTV
jgi:DNA-binding transcriptional MocR family regulator